MTIAPNDRGFTLGQGLFETVLFAAGELRHWDDHMARLQRGCRVLGLPAPDPGACERAAREAAGPAERAAVRLTWSAGPGGRGLDPPAELRPALTVTAGPAPPASGPLALATASVRRNEHSPASRLKTLSYLDNVMAREEARAAGADEALMLNTAGEVACAAAANVFWIEDGAVCTPALACGVLDGIGRAQVRLACAELGVRFEETRAGPERLADLPMFLTNSLIGLRPVAALDGRPRPPSPLMAQLTHCFSRMRFRRICLRCALRPIDKG